MTAILRIVCVNAQCQEVLRIRPTQAGKQVRCPRCGTAMMAPSLAEAAAHAQYGETEEEEVQPSGCARALFYFGSFLLFLAVLVAIAGFEFYLITQDTQQSKGPTADLLLSNTWKINKVEKNKTGSSAEPPAWASKDSIWTFYPAGKAETGRLMDGTNRYERDPDAGFRTWQWTTQGDDVTMTGQGEKAMKFKVERRPKDMIALVPAEEDSGPTLVAQRINDVETFPDLRVVFYGGVLTPALIAFLLAWLVSREVFYNGCLRFLLGWPLTALLGAGLGAGAGFLLDVLDDHSHIAQPYWQELAMLQVAVGAGTGLILSVLSSLRPSN